MLYAYIAAGIASIGGLLFGYDVGVISGVLDMEAFNTQFPYSSAFSKGFIVSSLTLGCFVGSLAAYYIADFYGRRFSIICGGILFAIGGVVQASAFSLGQIYAGRILSGLAIGVLSMAVPLYQSEIAPKHIRGSLVGFHQLAITFGILVSFFVNYGSSFLEGNITWRLPLAIQITPAIVLLFSMSFLPKTPRWLVSQGRKDEAMCVLRKVCNNPEDEFMEIELNIQFEREIGPGSWYELFEPNLFVRLLIGVSIQAFQQLTGINAIMYYAPSIFHSFGIDDSGARLLATAINGVVNFVFTIPCVIFLDKLGRRPLLLAGSVVMSVAMGVLAVIFAVYTPTDSERQNYSYVCLAIIFCFVAFFAFTWGPIGWVYPSEIYPNRVRAKCLSITTVTNWTFNFLVGLVVPKLMESIKWGLYGVFAVFGVIMFINVFFFVPETKGLSLEEIDQMFDRKRDGKSYRRSLLN
ncbi:sugar transporter [Basidiobolus meristosporus CBS 931.73]|uniref:Sugar transporter n=1 Tax=Basidiobolus meristosporus CBS 931.73 TaxID=1314790 RepID=A0A1Y1YD93_9FUNG|nr:sugar transporter [Basidiobolus meristosporus CBS 931.73]|eukprot:ORX95957.1 sugar transporter [Basidiobolus meristosporus CBS 931.73]